MVLMQRLGEDGPGSAEAQAELDIQFQEELRWMPPASKASAISISSQGIPHQTPIDPTMEPRIAHNLPRVPHDEDEPRERAMLPNVHTRRSPAEEPMHMLTW